MKKYAIVASLLALVAGPACASPKEIIKEDREVLRHNQELVNSTLVLVEKLSEKAKSLDDLGKQTLDQSTTILDMGESALPALLKNLRDRRRNWKTRYWITDMLGYVGNEKTLPYLLKAVADEKEYQPIRLRALDSIGELCKKNPGTSVTVRKDLSVITRRVRNKRVKDKISVLREKLIHS